MPALIVHEEKSASLSDIAAVSQSLADDLAKLHLRNEGFTEEEYLSLDGSYLVEFVDGRIQVLPMPTTLHQSIVGFLYFILRGWVAGTRRGLVTTAPVRMKLHELHYREPDVMVVLKQNSDRVFNNYWLPADFVVEVVSESNRQHDVVTKRVEYAAAGIGEYWIIDPESMSVLQLILAGGRYVERASVGPTGVVESTVLEGFKIDVAEMFQDAKLHSNDVRSNDSR
jgi:Uma2 family endonuclease